MDDDNGKDQTEQSEDSNSLGLVGKGKECPDESQGVSEEAKAESHTGKSSQDAEERSTIGSGDDVERVGIFKALEFSDGSAHQPETKKNTDTVGDVATSPVAACPQEVHKDVQLAGLGGEQSKIHSIHPSSDNPCINVQTSQHEEPMISMSSAKESCPSMGKEGVKILIDQGLDSQPSTPRKDSEMLDEPMLTESPAYSEDGKLVIGTPRSGGSPGVEAIPIKAFDDVDRTRHPADLGSEVDIVGDFLPVDSTPSTSECPLPGSHSTPSASQCTPSASHCTPSTSYNETTETDLSLNQTPSTGPKTIRSKKRKKKKLTFARKKQRTMMPVVNQALDLDNDLERKLEENAAKNNLTAINVKSILHHVITNEHVLSMVRNTMKDAGLVEIEQEPAPYTPKLTRAKLKEATEKVGNMPYVWPLSPVKNKKATPGFIEINFSDDTSSDDEDYDPNLDELMMREESDYESVTSQMSDFGSPCASTPPRSVQQSINESEMEDSPTPTPAPDHAPTPTINTPKTIPRPIAKHMQVAPVPMGPPPPPINPDRLGDDDAFLRELAAVTKQEANIIAHRTRSKLTIDKPLEVIEASFVAPDAEHDTNDVSDVYESDHEDSEWKKWLASLYKTEDTANTEPTDDEQNDPEYNFLAEEETLDREDFRTDRAVRVSKKELNELLDEVVEAYGDEVDWLDDFDMNQFDQEPQSALNNLMNQKQKFSPSKFYTMPSSYSGMLSAPSPTSKASTSSKFRLGEVLSSMMAATSSADAAPMETPATTVVEATAATAAETTASTIQATVMSASIPEERESSIQAASEAITSQATGQPLSQETYPPPQQIHQQVQPSGESVPTVPAVVQQQDGGVIVPQAPPVAWTIEAKTLPSLTLNAEELEQFQQQMQQHIQLLCQMYLMARENDTLKDCANQAKQFLTELDLLAGVNEDGMKSQGNFGKAQFHSFFRACNLDGALELLKTPRSPFKQIDEESSDKKTGPRPKAPPLLTTLRNLIAKSDVFIHIELLPKSMYHDISRSAKIVFVEGEDKLIVRGLDQFSIFEDSYQLIQNLMMPCKTAAQIRNRIKNLFCYRKCKVNVKNPIVIYKTTNHIVHSPSMCSVVKPSEATAPINVKSNKLPKWVLPIQGVHVHIKECLLEVKKEKAKQHMPKLSPLKPKIQAPIQITTRDQLMGQTQVQVPVPAVGRATGNSVPVLTQLPPEASRYILAPNVGLTAGGLLLQPGQQILPQGLLPRTVCEVKYMIDSPQMSPMAAGSTPGIPQPPSGVESVSVPPTTQADVYPSANPVVNLPSSNTVSLASRHVKGLIDADVTASTTQASQVVPHQSTGADAAYVAGTTTNVTSITASQMELHNTVATAKTTSHSVVRTLQFSDDPASISQTPSVNTAQESNRTNTCEGVAVTLPQSQGEVHVDSVPQEKDQVGERPYYPILHRHYDPHNQKRGRTSTSSVPQGVGVKDPVWELIKKKKLKKKLSPRHGRFVAMSSLASKGISSFNRFLHGKSPERRHFRIPKSKLSPGKIRVTLGDDENSSPDSAKASQRLEEAFKSTRTDNSSRERRTSESDEDCIPLETALRQLDEEEETEKTASPRGVVVENLLARSCDESPSDTCVPMAVDEPTLVSTPVTGSVASETRPDTKHSPLQVTVRIDGNVTTNAPVPASAGLSASSEPMQGITIGSSVGIASQMMAVNRTQSPTGELSEGGTPPAIPSLPMVQQEDTTSQMSEGAASANSNPKLPFDLPTDQLEMMASTATGGKSPTLDEQPGAREFLSGGEQGGPGEDGEEEMEMCRGSNVKVAAKRIKSKLRKDLESTVVLLDPDIVNQDPHKEERELAFAKDFLDRVKEALHDNFDQYQQFLRVFNEHSEDPNSSIADLYYSVKDVLTDRPDLIEEFTAFMPPDVALQCGVFLECLEFSKARLFLRQVEVHFHKQPAHIQRVIKTMVQWGETQRNYQDLKEALIPLLKGQPHLEQELSMLFPDSRPPENYMMDFEEINLTDDKKMACDDFEEIELSESEEEEEGTVAKQHGRGVTDRNILDPWKGLNDELQYGTRSCKCNCHETSQDSRVQRKTRHCAYCSAMVTRAELISSLRGVGPGRRRAMRDGSVGRRRGTGVGKRQGRGSKLTNGAKGEDGAGGSYPTNEAVNHLSQMCDNLADYLQDNASATEDEDDVEDDEDHDDEEEDDDEDEHDDDDDVGDEEEDEDELGVATGDEDDDVDHEDDIDGQDDIDGHEDDEEEDEEEEDAADDRDEDDDDEGGVMSEDDADDEEEDGGDMNHMTSGESTDDLTADHSPCTSRGSRETMGSGNSNSGSQLSTSPASSHTTLLGSGVTMDTDSRSLTCSPTEFQKSVQEKPDDVSVESGTKGVPVPDMVSAEHEVKTQTDPDSESTKGKNEEKQENDGDGSIGNGLQETASRDEETPAPAGDQEGKGELKELSDGDQVEEGGGDPQQSSSVEADGASSGLNWNRDADRVLLQACQEEGASEETFIKVASHLNDKTPQQVKERFATLMKLFHLKESKDNDEPSNDEEDEEEEEEEEEESGEEEEENADDEIEV
ncbi:GON-4-like protein isoform X2 [Lytechinus variegatus]|uniref:GON-4-like protein isoform X2 n=1 Tax=Lytechinus variegatus TaxID=7654 RepID=UPI001BB11083|nr:GON-4-like protein isoform X2 [Lytechinus variegatus]